MPLSPEQREKRAASLALARAARAARRQQAKEPDVAAPQNLMTTISEADATAQAQAEAMPEVPDFIAERAAAQRQSREDAEMAAMTKERERQGFNPREQTPAQKGVAQLARQGEAMRLAARNAATTRPGDEPLVVARITKLGHGKVSMGIHAPGIGEAYYEWKEEAEFPLSIARTLENRGFVEIQE